MARYLEINSKSIVSTVNAACTHINCSCTSSCDCSCQHRQPAVARSSRQWLAGKQRATGNISPERFCSTTHSRSPAIQHHKPAALLAINHLTCAMYPHRFDEIKAKVYERLLRKLLHRRSKPAVVLLQLMPKGMAFGPGNKEKVPFHATLEDIYGAQAQYYDLPWLSFRNAMWRLSEFHT